MTDHTTAAIVAALQQRAGELSALAEEQMRPSLEERAQEWNEAAAVARRTGKAAAQAPAIDRAAVLREAADRFERECPDAGGSMGLCMCHAAEPLRRWADEAQP